MDDLPETRRRTAEKWLASGYGAASPYDAFSNYWWAISSILPPSKDSERRRISALIRDFHTEENAANILNENVSQVNLLMEVPVRDMRYPERTSADQIENFNSSSSALGRLDAVMMVVYGAMQPSTWTQST